MKMFAKISGILLLAGLVTGCAVGPDYQKTAIDTPASYNQIDGPWKKASPQDEVAKGSWWEMFGDPQLNDLEKSVSVSNQNLQASLDRVEEARALSRVAKSAFYPNISFDPSGSVFRDSANRPLPPPSAKEPYTASDVNVPLDLGYEADIWGRVRRSSEAATAAYQASVADLEAVRLIQHAEMAETYFSLRASDSELQILKQTVKTRQDELALIQSRAKDGASSDLEVAQAQNALATTQADQAGVEKQRAALEHAVAVLAGKTPESMKLDMAPLTGLPPIIPVGTPSDLLERRPDIAEAERNMAEANANIGVAKAAFFPTVQLVGTAGFESVNMGSIFDWPSRLWAIGPSLSLPIFDAGRNSANYTRAEAAYLENVANYRQQVLTALQEVEDGLTGLHFLTQQSSAEDAAVASAQKSFDLASKRYEGGIDSYLDVIDAQRVLLENQRQAVQTLGQQYVTSVLLVKALGGGWQDSAVKQFNPVANN